MDNTPDSISMVSDWMLHRMVERNHPRAAVAAAEIKRRAEQFVDTASRSLLARDLTTVLAGNYGIDVTVSDVEAALPAFLSTLHERITGRPAVAQ